MAITINPSNVQAVDRSVGFDFNLIDNELPVDQNVTVEVTITVGNKKRTIEMNGQRLNELISANVPLEGFNVTPGMRLEYTIEVYLPGNTTPQSSITGNAEM